MQLDMQVWNLGRDQAWEIHFIQQLPIRCMVRLCCSGRWYFQLLIYSQGFFILFRNVRLLGYRILLKSCKICQMDTDVRYIQMLERRLIAGCMFTTIFQSSKHLSGKWSVETLSLPLWRKADNPEYSFMLSCYKFPFYKHEEILYNLKMTTL